MQTLLEINGQKLASDPLNIHYLQHNNGEQTLTIGFVSGGNVKLYNVNDQTYYELLVVVQQAFDEAEKWLDFIPQPEPETQQPENVTNLFKKDDDK